MYFIAEVAEKYGWTKEYIEQEDLEEVCDMVVVQAIMANPPKEQEVAYAEDVF